jgi:hypothetical protein
MVASQGRRPGSSPTRDIVVTERETTVAGQRRVLTGLRCVCDSSTSYCELRTLPKLMTDHEPTNDAVPTEDPRPDGLRSADSLVLVNTGNGKGKSSSAFGMMIRAVARGWNVAVVQFIKSGDWKVGEEKIGRQLGVEWHSFGDGVHVGLERPHQRPSTCR